MATHYTTPGIYIEEIPLLPSSVVQVETAIPAFIGYTASGELNTPTRIKSLLEFERLFGGAAPIEGGEFTISVDTNNAEKLVVSPLSLTNEPTYKLYYALQLFFANGGGPCYIVSVGHFNESSPNVDIDELNAGLDELFKEDEPTLIVVPDAGSLSDTPELVYQNLFVEILNQCATLGDRFAILDILPVDDPIDSLAASARTFRNQIGTSNLKYGAAYTPFLQCTLRYTYREEAIKVDYKGKDLSLRLSEATIQAKKEVDAQYDPAGESLFHADNEQYFAVRKIIDRVKLVLPPSAAVAGAYAKVDRDRGVWKSPANVSLNSILNPILPIAQEDQKGLNVHSTGKSINAIRSFHGKGVLVWGARTLAGNDNEWRYISVRRFYNMVEESVKKAAENYVFEPNDANTWTKVKAMIENFLTVQWREGALAGAKAQDAFFVKVGLGETMTAQDVLNGRMMVEIGMAVVRPAEFIILRFSHKMMNP